jgi:hypothetical protein
MLPPATDLPGGVRSTMASFIAPVGDHHWSEVDLHELRAWAGAFEPRQTRQCAVCDGRGEDTCTCFDCGHEHSATCANCDDGKVTVYPEPRPAWISDEVAICQNLVALVLERAPAERLEMTVVVRGPDCHRLLFRAPGWRAVVVGRDPRSVPGDAPHWRPDVARCVR